MLQLIVEKLRGGNLFIAYRGTNHNGLDYIDEAIKSGAAAIAIDELEAFDPKSIPIEIFKVVELRKKRRSYY